MDLGYSTCSPKTPKCPSCPLKDICLAYAEQCASAHPVATSSHFPAAPVADIEDACDLCEPLDADAQARPGPSRYPMAKVRKAPREEATAVLVLESHDRKRVLVVQREETGLLAGQSEFIAIDLPAGVSDAKRESMLAGRVAALFGKAVKLDDLVNRVAEPEVRE